MNEVHEPQLPTRPLRYSERLAYAYCPECRGHAVIPRSGDEHEARCPCGWTFIEISTGGNR